MKPIWRSLFWLSGIITHGCFYNPMVKPPASNDESSSSRGSTSGSESETSDSTPTSMGPPSTGMLSGETSVSYTSTNSGTSSTENLTDSSTTTPTPVCGNGITDPGEACDDGNQIDDDSCNNLCVTAECGDGVAQAAEDCDDGNLNDDDACTSSCMLATCGDSFVFIGVEECDDGNQNDLDGCRTDCTLAIHRIVFVTSTKFSGNLGGWFGAHKKCASAASAAGIPAGPWLAWLSNEVTTPAKSFDTSFSGIYELPDGTVVAAGGWKDLTDGTLSHPIDQDEYGASIIPSTVWTNSKSDGTNAGTEHCLAWTSDAGEWGNVGSSSALDSPWTNDDIVQTCNNFARLYCFEDPGGP